MFVVVAETDEAPNHSSRCCDEWGWMNPYPGNAWARGVVPHGRGAGGRWRDPSWLCKLRLGRRCCGLESSHHISWVVPRGALCSHRHRHHQRLWAVPSPPPPLLPNSEPPLRPTVLGTSAAYLLPHILAPSRPRCRRSQMHLRTPTSLPPLEFLFIATFWEHWRSWRCACGDTRRSVCGFGVPVTRSWVFKTFGALVVACWEWHAGARMGPESVVRLICRHYCDFDALLCWLHVYYSDLRFWGRRDCCSFPSRFVVWSSDLARYAPVPYHVSVSAPVSCEILRHSQSHRSLHVAGGFREPSQNGLTVVPCVKFSNISLGVPSLLSRDNRKTQTLCVVWRWSASFFLRFGARWSCCGGDSQTQRQWHPVCHVSETTLCSSWACWCMWMMACILWATTISWRICSSGSASDQQSPAVLDLLTRMCEFRSRLCIVLPATAWRLRERWRREWWLPRSSDWDGVFSFRLLTTPTRQRPRLHWTMSMPELWRELCLRYVLYLISKSELRCYYREHPTFSRTRYYQVENYDASWSALHSSELGTCTVDQISWSEFPIHAGTDLYLVSWEFTLTFIIFFPPPLPFFFPSKCGLLNRLVDTQ